MDGQKIINDYIEAKADIEHIFKDEELRKVAGALSVWVDVDGVQLAQMVVNIQTILNDDTFKTFNDGEYVDITKILMNYREALLKVDFGGNTGQDWLYNLELFNKSFVMFKDLVERGRKDDIKALTKSFFLYSLREMKLEMQMPEDIDYSYLHRNYIAQWWRRRKIAKNKNVTKDKK